MKEVDTEDGFAWWLNRAKKGERVMYFDGFLMLERQRFIINGIERGAMPQRIKTADAAWRAYLEDRVVLVQNKRDEGEYEYIAVCR